MTLIAAVLTKDFVAQVSDRQISLNGQPWDEESNKAVVVCNHLILSYSGLAYIGGKRVDDWLVEVVLETKPGGIEAFLRRVAKSATVDFARLKLPPKYKRLGIMIAGWVLDRGNTSYYPIISTVSNALNDDWTWKKEAEDVFTWRLRVNPNFDEPEIFFLGQPVSSRFRQNTQRQIRKRLEKGGGPRVAVHILVNQIREIAAKNRLVGDSIMAASIPLKAVGTTYKSTSARDVFPEDEVASQHFVSGEDAGIRFDLHYIACTEYGYLPIKHGKIKFGEAARKDVEMAFFDDLIRRIGEAKDENDIEALSNCLTDLAKEARNIRTEQQNIRLALRDYIKKEELSREISNLPPRER